MTHEDEAGFENKFKKIIVDYRIKQSTVYFPSLLLLSHNDCNTKISQLGLQNDTLHGRYTGLTERSHCSEGAFCPWTPPATSHLPGLTHTEAYPCPECFSKVCFVSFTWKFIHFTTIIFPKKKETRFA